MPSQWVEVFRGDPLLGRDALLRTVRIVNKARRAMKVEATNTNELVISMRVPVPRELKKKGR